MKQTLRTNWIALVACLGVSVGCDVPASPAEAVDSTSNAATTVSTLPSGSMAITRWGTSRVDMFKTATGSNCNQLLHSTNHGASWDALGGCLLSQPAAISRYAGGIDIVAMGTDQHIWHLWCSGGCGASGDGSWGPWEDLGATTSGVFPADRDSLGFAAAPAVASFGGRFDVYARGPGYALWQKTWTGGATGRWLDWSIVNATPLASAPFALPAHTGPGTSTAQGYDVVAVLASGGMGHLWCYGECKSPSSYSPWDDMGGSFSSAPTATSWTLNRLDVFARGGDGSIYQNYWDLSVYNGYSGWGRLAALTGTDAPVAASTADAAYPRQHGRIDLYAYDYNQNLTWNSFSRPTGWSGFNVFSGADRALTGSFESPESPYAPVTIAFHGASPQATPAQVTWIFDGSGGWNSPYPVKFPGAILDRSGLVLSPRYDYWYDQGAGYQTRTPLDVRILFRQPGSYRLHVGGAGGDRVITVNVGAPAAPTNLRKLGGQTGAVDIGWTPVVGVDSYQLEFNALPTSANTVGCPIWGDGYESVASSTTTGITYRNGGLCVGSRYGVRIRSFKGTGDDRVTGGWSSWVEFSL